jgi:excisionase family DNA binding protein
MCFVIPPLPGEPLHSVQTVAARAGCSREAVYNAIRDGKISAATVAGRVVISESEVERLIRDWPVSPSGKAVAANWAEYRAWKQRNAAAQPAGEGAV